MPTIAQPKARARRHQLSTIRARAAFIAAYSTGGVVLRAARAAGVSRRVIYDWLHRDPEFAKQFQRAKDSATDLLEVEARRRAEEGWLEPVFQTGRHVGDIRKYDTALMCLLLKGNRPHIYRDRVEVTQHVYARAINPSKPSDEEVEDRILAAAEEIRSRRAQDVGA